MTLPRAPTADAETNTIEPANKNFRRIEDSLGQRPDFADVAQLDISLRVEEYHRSVDMQRINQL